MRTEIGSSCPYAILVLAVILVPIPTEIGITELTGLGALLAYGVRAERDRCHRHAELPHPDHGSNAPGRRRTPHPAAP